MSEVQPFDAAAIEAHFEREGVRYLRDVPGCYLALFGASSSRPFDVQVWVSAEGDDQQICVVRVMTKEYFPAEDGPHLLGLLNQWNTEYRWPKVYLSPAGGNPSLVYRVAEGQLNLARGIHPEGLDEMIRSVVGGGGAFFNQIREQHRPSMAPPVDVSDLEQRWEEAS